MKIVSILSACALGAMLANAAPYEVDNAHSSVGFKIKHMSISNVVGNFKDFSAEIDAENGKLNKLSAVVKTASVFTDNEKRDAHLQADDFFGSEKFPDMKFQMKEFAPDKVKGELTIRDVTKEVEFDYDFGGEAKQGDKDKIGFSLEGKIKRSDFNFAPGSGTAMLGDDIKISIEIEAVAK